MKKLLKKLLNWVSGLFNSLEREVKKYVPVAINIVEGVKDVIDSPVADVVLAITKKAIPGEKDDVLIDKVLTFVKNKLPMLLLELKMVNSIAGIEDPNEQLKAILAELKFTSDRSKNAFYHGLASLILESLSDGELTWGEAVMVAEYYYQNTKK